MVWEGGGGGFLGGFRGGVWGGFVGFRRFLLGAFFSRGSAPSSRVRSLRELQWSPSLAIAGADVLRRFAFQVGFPLAERGEAVHHGAVVEGALCCRDVFGFAGPGFLRRGLQRAAVGERDVPRQRAHLVDGVEMRGGVFVGLAARQERDTGHGGGHAFFQHAQRLLRDFFHRSALTRLLAGDRHVRLEHHAFERDAVEEQRLEGFLEHPAGDLDAAVDIVAAVHQHFRLDDRHDAFALAQRGVAGERMRIGADAGVARHAVLADVDHRAPFGEFGAEPTIFGEPLAQAVEAFGDHFARAIRQRLDALVDLDAGQRARLRDQLDQRRAVLGVLADGLVIEDDAGNIFRHRLLGAEQHLAIVAPCVGGRFHAERIEALLDGAGGFIGGQNAAAGGDHGLRHLVQFRNVHRVLP